MTRSNTRQRKPHPEELPGQPRLPSVALCVIARNEEELLGNCIGSAKPFVDEIVVVDTGSTDATREIASAHGARVVDFVWCDDFAAARNAAIDAATTDWILMLDADEELDPASGPLLKQHATQLPEGMICFAISIENRRKTDQETIWHAVNRFFPRREDIRYKGAIHEDVFYLPDPAHSTGFHAPAIRAFHYGYDPAIYAAKAKDERNMRLLELELERNPDNVRMLYHIGQQHFVAGRQAEAAAAFGRFAERADSLMPYYLVDAYRMWIESVVSLGDHHEVERLVAEAEARNALSALSREMLALYELGQGRPAAAKRHLVAALDPNAPRGIATPPGSGGWRSRLLLAEAQEKLGDRDAALGELTQAYVELPERLRFNVALQTARLTRVLRQHTQTRMWLMRASQAAPDEIQAHEALLELTLDTLRRAPSTGDAADGEALERALAVEDWQTAYDLVMALPLGHASALVRLLFLARRLREQDAPDAALDLLARAIDVYEPSRQLYWSLLLTLKDVDRYDDALAAIDVLRALEGGEEPLPVAA